MNVPYDSRNSFYRSPMGAVEEGTQIHFKILVPRSLNCVNADLSIKHDFDVRERGPKHQARFRRRLDALQYVLVRHLR